MNTHECLLITRHTLLHSYNHCPCSKNLEFLKLIFSKLLLPQTVPVLSILAAAGSASSKFLLHTEIATKEKEH